MRLQRWHGRLWHSRGQERKGPMGREWRRCVPRHSANDVWCAQRSACELVAVQLRANAGITSDDVLCKSLVVLAATIDSIATQSTVNGGNRRYVSKAIAAVCYRALSNASNSRRLPAAPAAVRLAQGQDRVQCSVLANQRHTVLAR